MRFPLPKNPWHRGFMILALVSAVASFCYFFFYPELIARKMSLPVLSVLGWLVDSGLAVIGLGLIWPHPRVIITAYIHAAIFFSFYFLALITNGGDALFSTIIIVAILVITPLEFLLIGLVSVLAARRKYPAPINEGAFLLTTAALLGGWFVGVIVWGLLLPPQIIAKAEAAAQDKPYCLEAHGEHVSSIWWLTAFSMFSKEHEWRHDDFHGMMVLGEGESREYKNWSYRLGDFVAISDEVRKGQQLDSSRRCKPVPHFAAKL